MSKIAHIHVQSLLRLGKGVYSCCLILCKSYSNLELQFLLNRDVFQASLIPELHLLGQCIHSWKQFLLFPLHWRRSKETVIFFRRISVCISRTHCSLSDKLWAILLSKHHGGGSKDLGASELCAVSQEENLWSRVEVLLAREPPVRPNYSSSLGPKCL